MFRLPLYYVPKFQQGGLIYKDNMYPQPVNLQGVANSFGVARSQGYQEGLDNARLIQQANMNAMRANQLRMQMNDQIYRQTQDAFMNEVRKKQLELDNKRIEAANAKTMADLQFKFMEHTMFDVLPQDADFVNEILTRYNYKDPTNFNEVGDAATALVKIYRDPEMRQKLENKTLYKKAYEGMDQVYKTFEALKKDPEKKAFFDMDALEAQVHEMTKQLGSFSSAEDYYDLRAKQMAFGTEYTDLGDKVVKQKIRATEAQLAMDEVKYKQAETELTILTEALEGVEDPKEIMKVFNEWNGKYRKDETLSLSEQQGLVLQNMLSNCDKSPLECYQDFMRVHTKKEPTNVNYNYRTGVQTDKNGKITAISVNQNPISQQLLDSFNREFGGENKKELMYFDTISGDLVIQDAWKNADARNWLLENGIMSEKMSNEDFANSASFAKFDGKRLFIQADGNPRSAVFGDTQTTSSGSGDAAPADWADLDDPFDI